VKRVCLILLVTAGMGWGQTSPYERKASETDKPAVFGYMISDFFHQRYREGPGPLWRTVGWLLAVDLLLLADLARRRGWRR